MRIARITSPKKIEVIEETGPDLSENKVLVRLLRAAICGSDLPYFSQSFDTSSYPLPAGYPGHECLGVIEDSDSDTFKPGDHVMYYPEALDGFKELHATDASRVQKIPDDGDVDILIITQLLGAVAHGFFRIEKTYNKNVVIMGQGPVGLLFTALAKNSGARRVIAVDPVSYRLETAKKMGADIIINPLQQDPVEAVAEITGKSMADIVIDAYGQETEVINQCFEMARHNGQVAFFGICFEECPRLNFNRLFRKELRLIASVGPDLSIDYPYALDMITRNVIDVRPLVTHVLPFEEIQRGFDMASTRTENAIKVLLKF